MRGRAGCPPLPRCAGSRGAPPRPRAARANRADAYEARVTDAALTFRPRAQRLARVPGCHPSASRSQRPRFETDTERAVPWSGYGRRRDAGRALRVSDGLAFDISYLGQVTRHLTLAMLRRAMSRARTSKDASR